MCRISDSRKYTCWSKNSPSSNVIKTCEYDRAHIATVVSKSKEDREGREEEEDEDDDEGVEKEREGEEEDEKEEKEEKGVEEDDEERGGFEKEEKDEDPKGDANVGEEPNGVEIEEDEEDKEDDDAEEDTPLATKSENSFELLKTAHIVVTNEDPRETELMIECVWEVEVICGGKREGEVIKSTKREREERPGGAREEKGRGEEGEEVGIAGTWEGGGRNVWNILLRVSGVEKCVSVSYIWIIKLKYYIMDNIYFTVFNKDTVCTCEVKQ